MMVYRDGGAAFPWGDWDGMSLRDYFAAQVVVALVGISTPHRAASTAYDIADAMIEVRAGRAKQAGDEVRHA